ncbi:ribonuclease PH [Bythopirellula polymerisocia]|uniref:Ribonuclease PH n=1 Tax=Bythopirellula polymerisocia TaxID=2528003 RepID=A0A5C6D0U3_9BACT|nr:ribonuclease PH [Bythopirellula polymerisocia]TWU28499.1 Ribonuclease PH [Bythopirellula polymerisocia]
MMPDRANNRAADTLRTFLLERNVPGAAAGKVLVRAGSTTVLCTASIENQVPPWLEGRGKGWVTAEYNMLPGSTSPRKQRDRSGKVDGRSSEIQRLIGRSLRGIVDLAALGERTITVDCDVLEADGGTRTASISGGYVALAEAIGSLPEFQSGQLPFTDSIAAVSVGIVDGEPLLDLDYSEDVRADVDMNVVMTGRGRFVEVQGSGEEATFDKAQLLAMIDLAERGITQLSQFQAKHLEH